MEVRVLILTPMSLEYEAVAKHLTGERKSYVRGTAAYEQGQFAGNHHHYTVFVCEPDMKNVEMALATEKAIQEVDPHIALLIGVAGGVKDVRIGDVLVAKKAYGYEGGKETVAGFKARPAVESFSANLIAHAQLLSRTDHWRARCTGGAPHARVLLGPIAAGDKVIAATESETYQRIQNHYNDTRGLEMEAIGFAMAIQPHRNLHGLVIRGISDMCANKDETDLQNWQLVAAERAAAFGFELLYELDASTFIIPLMDSKTLAKEIYNLLFPLPESFKEIGRDFANATNNEVREIWKRVKPLFIEEVEELAKTPDDADVQAGVRNRLKRELAGNEGLQQELRSLLEHVKDQMPAASISVTNSQNVMIGSRIKVGGDFRMGSGD